jgi:hypothetical protein
MFLSCEIVFATTTESQCYGSHLIRCLTDWPPGCPIVSASERDCPGLFADMTMRYIHSDAVEELVPSAKPFIVNDLKIQPVTLRIRLPKTGVMMRREAVGR